MLATYLLVVLHHTASVLHDAGHCTYAHAHHGFEEHHHDHQFHIGVFHFLGHLLENISHYDYLETTYLLFSQETVDHQRIGDSSNINSYIAEQNIDVYLISCSAPNSAFAPFLLYQSKKLNNPLRAPPIC